MNMNFANPLWRAMWSWALFWPCCMGQLSAQLPRPHGPAPSLNANSSPVAETSNHSDPEKYQLERVDHLNTGQDDVPVYCNGRTIHLLSQGKRKDFGLSGKKFSDHERRKGFRLFEALVQPWGSTVGTSLRRSRLSTQLSDRYPDLWQLLEFAGETSIRPAIHPSGLICVFAKRHSPNARVKGATRSDSDLFYSYRLDGKWTRPRPFDERINSHGNEIMPSFSEAGELFFASNGRGGKGGFDLFSVPFSLDQRKFPQSLSFDIARALSGPFNSEWDDFGLIWFQEEARDIHGGYFASRRSFKGDADIYRFEILHPEVTGKLSGSNWDSLPNENLCLIPDNEEDTLWIPTDSIGHFHALLEFDQSYHLSFPGFPGLEDWDTVLTTWGLRQGEDLSVDVYLPLPAPVVVEVAETEADDGLVQTFGHVNLPPHQSLPPGLQIRIVREGWPADSFPLRAGIFDTLIHTGDDGTFHLDLISHGQYCHKTWYYRPLTPDDIRARETESGQPVAVMAFELDPGTVGIRSTRIRAWQASLVGQQGGVPEGADMQGLAPAGEIVACPHPRLTVVEQSLDTREQYIRTEMEGDDQGGIRLNGYPERDDLRRVMLVEGEGLLPQLIPYPEPGQPLPDEIVLYPPEYRLNHPWLIHHQSADAGFPEDSRLLLEEVALILREHPDWSLQIDSHSDSQGDAEANLNLSFRRGETILHYLEQQAGVSGDRIMLIPRGEFDPIRPCYGDCTEENHAANRRSELYLLPFR